MPPLSTLRAKTAANPNSVFNGGENLAPAITPENLVQIPAAAPLDLPVPQPQRGVFPPSMVMVSDRSDSTRVFRGPNTRSAVFQNPAQPTATQIAAAISTPAAVAAAVEILVNNQKTASQSILNFLNSTTVQFQSGPNGQITATAAAAVGDGLTHLEPTITPGSWESDPAYIILRDEFTGFHANGALPVSPYIGQLGWSSIQITGGTIRNTAYYIAGNSGVIQFGPSSATAGDGNSLMLDGGDASATATQGFPLTYVGGWQAEYVFRWPKFFTQSVANPASKLRLYLGFGFGPVPNGLTYAPRSAGFIGLRYDTDPNTWTLSAAANGSGGNVVYSGTFTGVATNAFVGQTFTVSGFVTHTSNNITNAVCVASTSSSLTLVNPATSNAETNPATATGVAFSDTGYVFEAVQNAAVGSNLQGTTYNTGIAIDNNWHRFRMRSLVAGTILFSLDGGTEIALTMGAQTLTASSANSQYLAFTQEIHSGGLQVTDVTQPIATGPCPCPGTPVVVAGASGGTLGAFNGTWNAIEQQQIANAYIDTSSISSNAGGDSTTGTMTFYNNFAPFMMLMNDSTGSTTVKCVFVDFFSFVWNPGLSAAGGTPVATNPRGW